jgi:hypothetical protein
MERRYLPGVQGIPGHDVAGELAPLVQGRVGARNGRGDRRSFRSEHSDMNGAEERTEGIRVELGPQRNREHTNSSCEEPVDTFPRSWFTAPLHTDSYEFHAFAPSRRGELERGDRSDDHDGR